MSKPKALGAFRPILCESPTEYSYPLDAPKVGLRYNLVLPSDRSRTTLSAKQEVVTLSRDQQAQGEKLRSDPPWKLGAPLTRPLRQCVTEQETR